jgi:hypothetical protein
MNFGAKLNFCTSISPPSQSPKPLAFKGRITNKEYHEINNTTDRTALRDLETLIEMNIIKRIGEKKVLIMNYELHHNCTNCTIIDNYND